MESTTPRVKDLLERFEFSTLFVEELGWDRYHAVVSVNISDELYELRAIAEKRGVVAWLYEAPEGALLPDRPVREKIGRQVAKFTLEHLIVFVDSSRSAQVWCWPKRNEPGRPARLIDHFWRPGSQNTAFIQKLHGISFRLSEENELTLPKVAARLEGALSAERVTKRFYDQFKAEHKAFLGFISGITDVADREWYASLMLNRLMFIYFMQRKGFMNDERDYLRRRLEHCKREKAGTKFYTFYRYFLLRLFHEGLGGKDRNSELENLLGRIPYLNGGLFELHPIEERYGSISIPDEAFERIFDFFDSYTWHLDERPLRDENEINPDVLGYIFEKYINQKQMGAYYTKEDITEYISKNTIIPYLFDTAKARCKIAFENPGGTTIWDHLRDDPDRYIYPAVKHGITWDIHADSGRGAALDSPRALPGEITTGIRHVSARACWNLTAPSEFALPTETWREVVARRGQYEQLREKLGNGHVYTIDDLITYNLDIRRFAQDVIERCDNPDLLRAFWKAIEGVTILDPTCGSGAFLFAALNILEPLYQACLERMEAFIGDLERSSEKHHPKKFQDFRTILARVSAHPNKRYFILKSIILNNLFGVDIMEEAVEICKLRLFLKLAAQVEPDPLHENLGIEPLPDIDFNVRCGNSLVGYATYEKAEKTAKNDLLRHIEFQNIRTLAADLQQKFDCFRDRQMKNDGSVPFEDKVAVRHDLIGLAQALNIYIGRQQYGIESVGEKFFEWMKNHQPFHWFLEFNGILRNGGFDVIIGNPPYVEIKKVLKSYEIHNFSTSRCGNLYAPTLERILEICREGSRVGVIVPLSLITTERMKPLQKLMLSRMSAAWFSSFDVYPSKLFDGAKQRLTIVLTKCTNERIKVIYTTRYNRWRPQERSSLLEKLNYAKSFYKERVAVIPKLGSKLEQRIIEKMDLFSRAKIGAGNGMPEFYVHRIPYNYIKATDFVPFFRNKYGVKKSEDYKGYSINDNIYVKPAIAILNSNLFFFRWYVLFEGYHCGRREIESYPFGFKEMDEEIKHKLSHLSDRLMSDFRYKAKRKKARYRTTGNVEYDEFYPRLSKGIIDQIDDVLSLHYGLDEEELDFIINFDQKYRVGSESHRSEIR